MHVDLIPTIRRAVRRTWRDFLSVYYANTPIWRWLKSAALLFLGFFAWTGGAVLLSVKPQWTALHYAMAYGFLLIVWGPFTHFVVVPTAIKLRRTAESRTARTFARHASKINLTVFVALVVVFGTLTPGVMLLEFSPTVPGSGADAGAGGDLVCDVDTELVACHVENARGIDHVVVTTGGETIAVVEEPPFGFEIETEALGETRTGKEFTVEFRDERGERIQRHVRSVPA